MVTTECDLLTVDDLKGKLKVSRATIYRLMELDGLPRPIKVGGANRWLGTEVSRWLGERPRARIQGAEESAPTS